MLVTGLMHHLVLDRAKWQITLAFNVCDVVTRTGCQSGAQVLSKPADKLEGTQRSFDNA